MKKNLVCIICPRGCALEVDINADAVSVCGNACPKGKEYAVNECTNPVRTVTATVRVSNRPNTMVSVKTNTPVPKASMMQVMEHLRKTQVQAPVSIGDVVLENICGSSIIVTKAVD
jgi:CxxC motif-containing protein